MIPAIIIGAVIEGILLVIGLLIYINVLRTRKELNGFVRSSKPVRSISPAGLDIYPLPRPVTEYLKKALHEKPGKFKITALKQSGNIKVAGRDSYQTFRAEQYIRLDRPGFIWLASVKFLRFFWVSVRDIYTAGRSEILVRFISAFRLSRVEGNVIAASSLIRYLLEMVWSPFLFACQDHVKWENIDDSKSLAYISDGNINGSAIFYFDENRLISKVESQDRYMLKGKRLSRTDFRAELSDYKQMGSYLVPAKAAIFWKDKDTFEKTSEIRIECLKNI